MIKVSTYKVALAGNPNVGKSTVFNELTGMHQHTGNWPGKTVSNASGFFSYHSDEYKIYDLPGTYSLISHSKEEDIAREFMCFGDCDATIVVCDATCLERNLNLVLQILEMTSNVLVCINLIDEAERKGIVVDLEKLKRELGVPVVKICARDKVGFDELLERLESLVKKEKQPIYRKIEYPLLMEDAIEKIQPIIENKIENNKFSRWITLRLLEDDNEVVNLINQYLDYDIKNDKILQKQIEEVRRSLLGGGFNGEDIKELIVSSLIEKADDIAKECVKYTKEDYLRKDRKIDRVLTSKKTGIPLMILLLLVVFWITISGANYPSEWLYSFFTWIERHLVGVFNYFHAPNWLTDSLVLGVYRILSWVVSVMLPPMAIFFPMFTILEDFGYLPRIAFNLDKIFKKCKACGKQALTMCMGFGCNAVGVTGTRIIDSPRERLIAILTNCFVPCNGRFPTIISIITMFFIGFKTNLFYSFASALLLTLTISLGIGMTFLVSKILSSTILKGVPSQFTLELPPYRKPKIGKVIIRSIFDRTLFVLGRAVVIAAPAGLIIWIMANVNVSGLSLLGHCANALDPFAKLLGLDGIILMAFILGFPANEIVIPIMMMGYLMTGTITDFSNLSVLKELLIQNGWTILTAINFILLSLFHFPCSTTCLTIKKETGSIKWTIIAFILPTLIGVLLCMLSTFIFSFF